MGPGEAEGMVEAHAAVPRRPGHGGLRVVVKAETEFVNDEICNRQSRCVRPPVRRPLNSAACLPARARQLAFSSRVECQVP